MLIDFFRNTKYKMQYFYESDDYHIRFASNNNLSFRKKDYGDKFSYPLDIYAGEDVYICIKALKNNCRFAINKNVKIKHHPRENLRLLSKQFFGYGRYFVRGILKNNYKDGEIFISNSLGYSSQYRYKNIKFKFVFPILMYLTTFHLFVVSLFLSLIFAGFPQILLVISSIIYFGHDIKFLSLGLKLTLQLSWAKLIVNMSLFTGNIIESFLNRSLIIAAGLNSSNRIFFKVTKYKTSKVINHTNIPTERLISLATSKEWNNSEITFFDERYSYTQHHGHFILFRKREFFHGHEIISFAFDKHSLLLLKPQK